MSDILIKKMEMPESCPECPFADYKMHCPLTDNTYNWGIINRPSDCPLVEVPKHGRLIDADALTTYPKPIGKLMMFGGEYVYTQTAIDDAPTIIEAECE